MGDVGADYVYLSDECSQDVFSLWSDTWSVGDWVNMPVSNYGDEFSDMFTANYIDDCNVDGDWLSDVLEVACPNTVSGYFPSGAVTTSGCSDELQVAAGCAEDCSEVLSPTDSGQYSITSSATTQCATCESVAGDMQNDFDNFVIAFDEQNAKEDDELEDNNNIDAIPASSSQVNDWSPETQDKWFGMEMEVDMCDMPGCQRPQRIAARRAELALAREGNSDCDYDDDDDDERADDDDCDGENGADYVTIRSTHVLPSSHTTSSRRGRSRAAEVNRNAMNARINRQKKKAYMASLETQKVRLLDANRLMKSELMSLVTQRDDLVNEVKYLRSVLANDSALAKLVQNISGPPLQLSSRFDRSARQRKDVESDHSYGPAHKFRAGLNAIKPAGGICLHVSEHQLSVELCHRCASMAGDGCRSDASS